MLYSLSKTVRFHLPSLPPASQRAQRASGRRSAGLATSAAMRAAVLVAGAVFLLRLELPTYLHGRAPTAGAIFVGCALWLAGRVRAHYTAGTEQEHAVLWVGGCDGLWRLSVFRVLSGCVHCAGRRHGRVECALAVAVHPARSQNSGARPRVREPAAPVVRCACGIDGSQLKTA